MTTFIPPRICLDENDRVWNSILLLLQLCLQLQLGTSVCFQLFSTQSKMFPGHVLPLFLSSGVRNWCWKDDTVLFTSWKFFSAMSHPKRPAVPSHTAVSHRNNSFKLFCQGQESDPVNSWKMNATLNSRNFFCIKKIINNVIKMKCFVGDNKLYR